MERSNVVVMLAETKNTDAIQTFRMILNEIEISASKVYDLKIFHHGARIAVAFEPRGDVIRKTIQEYVDETLNGWRGRILKMLTGRILSASPSELQECLAAKEDSLKESLLKDLERELRDGLQEAKDFIEVFGINDPLPCLTEQRRFRSNF